MPSVYQSSRAAFPKRDRCFCGSVVPSYSAMARVRQFTGNLSAITPSVRECQFALQSVPPSPRIEHPTVSFGDNPVEPAIEGVHLPPG
ncbi:UNVERIFIED_CONTAM: hypothetical protein Sangu_2147400 [Sesamum angustifolium]|uniref:Uncharacterized protein n=1 Tax=Sesamum angustifolium TaxID=2727405 RepID=A0AAW2LGM0_9LAMI